MGERYCPECGTKLIVRLGGHACPACDYTDYSPEEVLADKSPQEISRQPAEPQTASDQEDAPNVAESIESAKSVNPVGAREFGCLLGSVLLPSALLALLIMFLELGDRSLLSSGDQGMGIANMLLTGLLFLFFLLIGAGLWVVGSVVGVHHGLRWIHQGRPNALVFLLLSALLLTIPLVLFLYGCAAW